MTEGWQPHDGPWWLVIALGDRLTWTPTGENWWTYGPGPVEVIVTEILRDQKHVEAEIVELGEGALCIVPLSEAVPSGPDDRPMRNEP